MVWRVPPIQNANPLAQKVLTQIREALFREGCEWADNLIQQLRSQ